MTPEQIEGKNPEIRRSDFMIDEIESEMNLKTERLESPSQATTTYQVETKVQNMMEKTLRDNRSREASGGQQ